MKSYIIIIYTIIYILMPKNSASVERLNQRRSRINRGRSRRGEPVIKASDFEVGKMAPGRDGQIWIVKILSEGSKRKQWAPF